MSEKPERPTAAELVEALRALNTAVWQAHTWWAAENPEVRKANTLLAIWEWADRVEELDGQSGPR
ncbi:hypothetical protein [Nocardia brasiliensis]|uniref:hypothetical protein n=1 Tax=Nocardia brasiliensis TaxID=37326 RepID=UPI0004A6B052|nr:hypothetical protein [Nocardia brasiliensis]